MTDDQPNGPSERLSWPVLTYVLHTFGWAWIDFDEERRQEVGVDGMVIARDELMQRALGTVIRRRRRQAGKTLAQVAKATGTTVSTLSRLERGVGEVKPQALSDIAVALAADPNELILDACRDVATNVFQHHLPKSPPRTYDLKFPAISLMLIRVLDQLAETDDREERQQMWSMIRQTLAERLGVTEDGLKRLDEARS